MKFAALKGMVFLSLLLTYSTGYSVDSDHDLIAQWERPVPKGITDKELEELYKKLDPFFEPDDFTDEFFWGTDIFRVSAHECYDCLATVELLEVLEYIEERREKDITEYIRHREYATTEMNGRKAP